MKSSTISKNYVHRRRWRKRNALKPSRVFFSLGLGLACAMVMMYIPKYTDHESKLQHSRQLMESSELDNYPEDALSTSTLKSGGILLHTLGFFYMFAALAIVCDEFFVPALEVISETLNLQDDVAGATFMAAGGSAPELATSFVGTFVSRSNVGFGTVVGSAVFNILFVIGVCAMFAPGVLQLSAWPLARDSLYYAFSLGILIACFHDKKIEVYEAIILFFLYIVYVVLMSFNRSLQRLVYSLLGLPVPEDDENSDENVDIENPKSGKNVERKTANENVDENDSAPVINIESDSTAALKTRKQKRATREDRKHSKSCSRRNGSSRGSRSRSRSSRQTYHFGLHTLFSGRCHLKGVSPKEIPARLRWKVLGKSVIMLNRGKKSYRRLSTSNRASMSDVVLLAMASPIIDEEPMSAQNFENADLSQETGIRREALVDIKSEKKARSIELKTPRVRPIVNVTSSKDEEDDEDEDDDGPMDLEWPMDSLSKQVSYVLLSPLTYLLYYTVPDVRREGWEKYFMITFACSVFWIAAFSYLMVWWATVVGVTLSIPSEVMGLTVLAIGTSVPDLLESVIVTKDGKGDMAISSSIGSNIFDVTVGLPIPWTLYTIINGTSIEVGTSGLLISVGLLFAMLLSCVAAIAINGWSMTRTLGKVFFGLWFIFVAISLVVSLI